MDDRLLALSGAMSELSGGEDQPSSIFGPVPFFEESEVDWSGNGWLGSLDQLLPWLNLQGFELAANPADGLEHFFDQIGATEPASCFATHQGVWSLSEAGLNTLENVLEAAVEFKQKFESDLAEEQTMGFASKAWTNSWEDFDFAPALPPSKVNAKVNVWNISIFVEKAKNNKLDLNPSYQRDSVWSTKDASNLIESVLRGIPLPSVILHKLPKSTRYEIVDGKQRLTSILRFVGRHPIALKAADRLSKRAGVDRALFDSNFKEWKKAITRELGTSTKEDERNIWRFMPFPFHSRPRPDAKKTNDPVQKLKGKYYCQMRGETLTIQDELEEVRDIFESASEYKIPVIEYTNTDIGQIHHVFSLYNKSGKQLNTEELRNAKYHDLAASKLLILLSDIIPNADGPEGVNLSRSDLRPLHKLLTSCEISDKRYHWAKFVGWMMAFLAAPPKVGKGNIARTPTTAKFIDGMFDEIRVAGRKHPMSTVQGLGVLGRTMIGGAEILAALKKFDGIKRSFRSSKNDSNERWDSLPFMAAWLGCCMAYMGGVTAGNVTPVQAMAVMELTANPAYGPLEKQQTIAQWEYFGNVVPAFLKALGADLAEVEAAQTKAFGRSYLLPLSEPQQHPVAK